MHASVGDMAIKETPSERAARQLRALMDRHGIKDSAKFEKLMIDKGIEHLISQVTVRRILKAEARTAPEEDTLRRLAEALGESLEEAFPDRNTVIVERDGKKYALKSLGGDPVPEDLRQLVQENTVGYAERIAKAKKPPKKQE